MEYVVILKVKFVQSGCPSLSNLCIHQDRVLHWIGSRHFPHHTKRNHPKHFRKAASSLFLPISDCFRSLLRFYSVTHFFHLIPCLGLRSGAWLEANVSNCEIVWWLSPQAGIIWRFKETYETARMQWSLKRTAVQSSCLRVWDVTDTHHNTMIQSCRIASNKCTSDVGRNPNVRKIAAEPCKFPQMRAQMKLLSTAVEYGKKQRDLGAKKTATHHPANRKNKGRIFITF